jgi:hypothetical protein
MSMGKFETIDRDLRVHLNSLPGAPTILWEGMKHKLNANTTYLEPINRPIDSILLTVGKDTEDGGIYQINIHVPIGKGNKKMLQLIDNIAGHFGKLHKTGIVYIYNISRGPTVRNRAHIQTSVNIRYRSYNTNEIDED